MWQHMYSFAKQVLQRGYSVSYLISNEYQWMNEQHGEIAHYTSTSFNLTSMLCDVISFLGCKGNNYRFIFRQSPPSGILFVSWHPLNFLLMRLVKSLYPDVPIIIWVHEPYKDEKKLYGGKVIIIHLVEFFQSFCWRYIDVAIFHSFRAVRLFELRYPHFRGQKKMIPLQFCDDGPEEKQGRRYFSFLGRADQAKGIDFFFKLLEAAVQDGMEVEFQIVTSSSIDNYLAKLSPQALQKLRVINSTRISDAELRNAAGNSLAVFALYKETTQSGVTPISLMKGTPIIGTNIEGITEWVNDGDTAVIVSDNPTITEINTAILRIQKDFHHMTVRCRNLYLKTFDESNWDRYYGWIKELIPVGTKGVQNN